MRPARRWSRRPRLASARLGWPLFIPWVRLLDGRAETVRLGAARAILELGLKAREVVELQERVAGLEKQLSDIEHLQEDKAQWQPH